MLLDMIETLWNCWQCERVPLDNMDSTFTELLSAEVHATTGAVLGRQNTSSDNLPPNMAANDFLQWNATLLSCSNSRVK